MEDDNVAKPEKQEPKQENEQKQPPMFSNIPTIKKTLADNGYTDKFTILFDGADIAGGCDVTIADKRLTPIAKARTVVPGRPVVDQNSGAVYLEVFFANLRLIDGPEQKFSIVVGK